MALCLATSASRSTPSGLPVDHPPAAGDHDPVGAMGAAEKRALRSDVFRRPLIPCRFTPKDRIADLLFATVLHDPALESMRSKCRLVSVDRRLEFVDDPTLPLPERALSSGVEEWGERRVGPGDLGGLMRTYAELGVPERLLDAVAPTLKKTRAPFVLALPLLWLEAANGETLVVDSPLPLSGLINGVPLCAIDRHSRRGRQAIGRLARENAEIARFLSELACGSREAALGMAVFYVDSALTWPTLHWR